jgi:hypothetical protein
MGGGGGATGTHGVRTYSVSIPFSVSNSNATVDDTPLILSSFSNTFPINAAFMVVADVVGSDDAGNQASYSLRATFSSLGGGSTVQKGSTSVVFSYEDIPAWDAAIVLDGGNVAVQVTGDVATNIAWTCNLMVPVNTFP